MIQKFQAGSEYRGCGVNNTRAAPASQLPDNERKLSRNGWPALVINVMNVIIVINASFCAALGEVVSTASVTLMNALPWASFMTSIINFNVGHLSDFWWFLMMLTSPTGGFFLSFPIINDGPNSPRQHPQGTTPTPTTTVTAAATARTATLAPTPASTCSSTRLIWSSWRWMVIRLWYFIRRWRRFDSIRPTWWDQVWFNLNSGWLQSIGSDAATLG